MQELSTILTATTGGARASANQMFELLYGELRSLARAQLQRSDYRGWLNTTTLVHESYLRFLGRGELKPGDRHHFLAYASHVMRSIVVDVARHRMAYKRGSGQSSVTLNTDIATKLTASDDQIIRLHEALEELATLEPRIAQVVEMRYFGGLPEKEIAGTLAISVSTVQRDWEKARVLLGVALAG